LIEPFEAPPFIQWWLQRQVAPNNGDQMFATDERHRAAISGGTEL
jgi:hypothetical protein